MKTLGIGTLKAQFSEVVKGLQKGEEFAVSFGKKKEIIGFFVPKEHYIQKKGKRTLGIMEGKASFKIHDDFAISDEELVNL